MAKYRANLVILCTLFAFLVSVRSAKGAPEAKRVRCKDKTFKPCFDKALYCPNACLRTCVADCNTCQAVCPPPPPPPPPVRPKRVRCKDKQFGSCFDKALYCPASCARTCVADCKTCQPVCAVPVTPSSPPTTGVASFKRSRCKKKDYPNCYGMELKCPNDCPSQCEVDCVTCSPVCDCNKPGAVCQDPRFIGGDGITFYYHGKKDKDFCLVSDTNLHINGHFIGKRNGNMSRDFTWVQSLGVLFNTHRLSIAAMKTSTWDDSIDRFSLSFNGERIVLPDNEGARWRPTIASPGITIRRTRDTNALTVEVEGNFIIKATVVPITSEESAMHNYGITEEDCFAHLDLTFKFLAPSKNVSGVLGQTYASNYVSRVKMGVDMPVLGGDKEFSTSSIFATDCEVARFAGQFSHESLETLPGFGSMDCGGGIGGRGQSRLQRNRGPSEILTYNVIMEEN